MKSEIAEGNKLGHLPLVSIFLLGALILSIAAYAVPSGPTALILGNVTKNSTAAVKVNSTINGTISPGGYIFITRFTSVQQNTRWKGYVGNVTGTLTLDDANDNTLFQWTLTAVTGEVYATRSNGNINWTGINCTWIADGIRNGSDGPSYSNRTPEVLENQALSHTSKDDNITATFTLRNHSSIAVGTRTIGKNECFSAQTWQRDVAQTFLDSDNANFTEALLYDGAFNKSTGNIIYETKIENNIPGFASDSVYNFQMILPENGASSFTSSTAYYFYVELT